MLTKLYIEALLADEGLADQIWEAWDKGEIDDELAAWAWWLIATRDEDMYDQGRASLNRRLICTKVRLHRFH